MQRAKKEPEPFLYQKKMAGKAIYRLQNGRKVMRFEVVERYRGFLFK